MKAATPVVVLFLSACAGSPKATPTESPAGAESCAVARPDFGGPATAAERALFAYDAAAPLNLERTVQDSAAGVEISAISFDSPDGGRVTGLLFDPYTYSGPRPGLIVMHGMPSSASEIGGFATQVSSFGAVGIAIDAPFARRGGEALQFTVQDRAEQIQLIKDLQRAVDVLRSLPNVDDDRIGYIGFSYGGAMGALFAAVERRIRTAVLVVPDGGLVTHSTSAAGQEFMASLSCADRNTWLQAMTPIEPIRFIAQAAPTPLLIQSGRQDEIVPPADAEALHAAAPEGSRIVWYDAGHGLSQQAAFDGHAWLVEHIGIEPL